MKAALKNDIERFLLGSFLDENIAILGAEEFPETSQKSAVLGGDVGEEPHCREFRGRWLAHEFWGDKSAGRTGDSMMLTARGDMPRPFSPELARSDRTAIEPQEMNLIVNKPTTE